MCAGADVHVVETDEIFVGGELGVKNEVAWQLAVGLVPELDEAKDFVVLLALAQVSVGVAEGVAVGVLSEEGENALLAARAHGDVVALHNGIVAVVGNRVEVEVEGPTREWGVTASRLRPAPESVLDSLPAAEGEARLRLLPHSAGNATLSGQIGALPINWPSHGN